MLICLLFETIKNEIPNTMGERSITDSTISRFSNYKYINILNIFIYLTYSLKKSQNLFIDFLSQPFDR